MLWRWMKTAFSRQLSERFRNSGKGSNVIETATQQDFCKETDSQGVGKIERIALMRAFLCLHEQALYSLVFFLDIQTFYQLLFAQVYSVRMTPICLLFSHLDSFVNMTRTRV